MSLDAYFTSLPGRCPGCGFHLKRQQCACAAIAAGASAMTSAITASPDEAARVEAAIRQLAATGRPFSANDAREIHGVKGGVVGATFGALKSAGVIRCIGGEASTDRGTHGKTVARWVAVESQVRAA